VTDLGGSVREYSSPLSVVISSTGNLTDDVVSNAVEAPGAVVFSRRTPRGWGEVTAATSPLATVSR
jgi:long-chain acyl-CoA synthetase